MANTLKHKKWWCRIIYNKKCPCCKIRQILCCRHFGPEDQVKQMLRADVLREPFLTAYEKNYVLVKTNLLHLEGDQDESR